MNYEEIVMQLIVKGGNARANAMKAIQKAREGEFENSEELMDSAKDELNEAHKIQTEIIQSEVRNEGVPVTLLMVHAQDHLMNALTVKELAKEIIETIKERSI